MIFYMNLLRNTKFLAGWQQRTLICHMISDIHTEFTSNLTFRDKQAIVAELLYHYINRWKDSIRSNILLSGIFKLKLHVEKDGIINELRNCWR